MVPESPASCTQRPRSPVHSTLPCTLEKEPAACLYSAMLRAENKVGGGEGLEGVYGSITRAGMTKVLEAFQSYAQLDEKSVILDIGSGLGRPLLHAIVHSGVAATFGIEVDAVKCQKASPFIQHVVAEMQNQGISVPVESLPKIICAPIEQVPSLEPATHIYAAWEGFARSAMQAVGKLFSTSATAKAITIVQRSFRQKDEAQEMEELGFGCVKLVDSVAVNMAGSRRRLMAYCFVKDPMPSCDSKRSRASISEDLTTMSAFQPEAVANVLAAQAKERALTKAASSSGTEGMEAVHHTQNLDTDLLKDKTGAPGRVGPAASDVTSLTAGKSACSLTQDSQQSQGSALAAQLRRSLRKRS